MRPQKRIARVLLAACILCAVGAQDNARSADTAEGFYAGKRLKLVVAAGAGGGYDIYGRLLARYLPRHIPGHPSVIVVNMPGASSLTAANYMTRAAPKDGTEMLMILQTLPMIQLAGGSQVHFDLARFQWLGNMSDASNVVVSWQSSRVKTIEDARNHELLIGATTATSLGGIYPAIMNGLLGTKFKVIKGYESGEAIDLAMERGEVEGRAGVSWASLKAYRAEWVANKRLNVLAQMGHHKEADLPGVPSISELAGNDADRDVLRFYSALVTLGRAIAFGPDVPSDRVDLLRRAFDATIMDADLLADAKRADLEISALGGAELQTVVSGMVRTKQNVLQFIDPSLAGK